MRSVAHGNRARAASPACYRGERGAGSVPGVVTRGVMRCIRVASESLAWHDTQAYMYIHTRVRTRLPDAGKKRDASMVVWA